MEKLKDSLNVARRALEAFAAALSLTNPDDLQRDGCIQRFEFTFEAVWKCGMRYLSEMEGVVALSPKAVFRGLGKVGVLSENEVVAAMAMTDDRNMTVHTYIEQVAQAIYERLGAHLQLMQAILERAAQGAG